MSTNVEIDLKHRSRALTEGAHRAAARAYLKGIGYDDEDLSKPIIGVASTWIETMPCNFHLRALAAKVKDGIREAGGTPMEFNTIAISDGITMGTSGMKTSLVSREVIADSIELVARGRFQGRDVTIIDVFEAVGKHAIGEMTDAELAELESVASPGAGACGGQFTANTMAMAFEMLGICPMGPSGVPAQDATKAQAAFDAGRLVMDVLRRNQRPSDLITRASLENAIAAVTSSGGSTNGVLHLLAVAKEAGVELDIDDFDRISDATPLLCDLSPGGRYNATDMFRAGGTAVLAKRLKAIGMLNEDAP